MKKLLFILCTLLFLGGQTSAQNQYGKIITISQDTTINILDFYQNTMGNVEDRLLTRIVKTNNGKYKINITIPLGITDVDFAENCKKISETSFTIELPGFFSFAYSKQSGERVIVGGHLNYECELLLDGTLASDTIFIQSDEDLKKEIGVPTGIYKNCWWLFDQLIEENVLPYTANKVPLKDLVGNNKERLIILQTNDGSYNSDENGEPLGYSRDSVIIIDQRVPTAISSVSKEEIRITRTTCGFIIQGAKSGQKLCLYSLSGQLVWSDSVKGSSQEVMLPGISGGTYILRVENVSLKVIF